MWIHSFDKLSSSGGFSVERDLSLYLRLNVLIKSFLIPLG